MAPTLRCISDTNVRLQFDFKTNLVSVKSGSFSGDSATFSFITYSFAAYKPLFRYPRKDFDSTYLFSDYPGTKEQQQEKKEELFSTPGIQKSGAITRGLSVGNTQNGFVNSSLNLQLEGQITSKIRMTALLSDQNVPFQPQGNTQQIRELDRILIQLDHQQGQLQAGDVVLQHSPSAFLRYYKNIQGGQLRASWDSVSENSQTKVGAGIAKGKFASIVVAVKEGVQGPYRLRPPNNPDLLVVILANSERIYFDNRLLKRGFNQDYVIDYNTGDLTLNNHLLITRFTRLRCDFEYAERNYSRTIFMGEHEERAGPFSLTLSHYQEQDNSSRPLSFTLDSTALDILKQAGDQPTRAVLPAATSVSTFQEGQLLYNLVDTIINGVPGNFYRIARSGDTRIFQLLFSDVGAGNGAYIFDTYLGNGRAFRFIGPGNGNFAPVRQVVLPNLRSMTRGKMELQLSESQKLSTELALSRFDQNRFSSLDDEDNGGNAQFLQYTWHPNQKEGNVLRPSIQLAYTRLSKNFSAIDRFRPIEFDRDWNAQGGDTLRADDHLAEAQFFVEKAERWRMEIKSAFRKKGENVQGTQHSVSLMQRWHHVIFKNMAFALNNQRKGETTNWYRLSSELSLDRFALVPGYAFQLDQNRAFFQKTDSIIQSAMYFQNHQVFLRARDSSQRIFSLVYQYREDSRPLEGKMEKALFSHNVSQRWGQRFGENHRADLMFNYRKIGYASFQQLKNEDILAIRLDYQGSLWEDALRQEFTYTTNTGQELKRTFQFIRVSALGEGTHQWIDYNGDGLQDLDEFVEALRPEDRQYIKIFTPTSEFVTAFANSLNYRLNLNAPATWSSGNGLKSLLSRFSMLTSLAADQKTLSSSGKERYLPTLNEGSDNLLALNRILRNTLFWNRTQSDIGGDYSFLNSWQKTLLSNGFSLRKVEEHRFTLRKNLGSFFNVTLNAAKFTRGLNSDVLVAQNYRITGWETGPETSWQPNTNHRITLQWFWNQKNNTNGEEQTFISKLGMEYRFNKLSSRTLNSQIRWIKIAHIGTDLSPAAYEMLEGLRPGNNLTWMVNLQQKLSQGLQILFTYEGRKSLGINTIHLGRIQANLLF